jgi:hypothetical protein
MTMSAPTVHVDGNNGGIENGNAGIEGRDGDGV